MALMFRPDPIPVDVMAALVVAGAVAAVDEVVTGVVDAADEAPEMDELIRYVFRFE
jgi:hypothetical protein